MSFSDDIGDRSEPRLVTVTRRRFLGSVALGGAFVSIPGLGCGTSDAEVFAAVTESPAPSTSPSTTSSSSTIPNTTNTIDTVTADEPGSEMLVSFSYAPDGTGKQENPYIAVWVETADGELVDTISLWFDQSQKGDKWLNELRSWYGASGRSADITMSAATRSAGTYTVAWDLTDLDGAPVAMGDYVLFVESAREHGPHNLTSAPISSATPTDATLADDGELRDLTVTWA